MSQPTKSRPIWLATRITTKLPAAGSTTRSPGLVTAPISRAIRPAGFAWGWVLRSTFSAQRLGMPWSRHVVFARSGGFCRMSR